MTNQSFKLFAQSVIVVGVIASVMVIWLISSKSKEPKKPTFDITNDYIVTGFGYDEQRQDFYIRWNKSVNGNFKTYGKECHDVALARSTGKVPLE